MSDGTEFSDRLPDDFYLELGKILTTCGYMDILFDGFIALCSFDETIEEVLKKHYRWTLGQKRQKIVSLITDLKNTKLGDLYFSNLDLKNIQDFIDRRNDIVHSYYGLADGKVFRLKSNSVEEELTVMDLRRFREKIELARFDLIGLHSLALGYREIFTEKMVDFVRSKSRVCPNPQAWNGIYKGIAKFSSETQSMPKPLILAAWAKTTDGEKQSRLIEQIMFAGEYCGLGKLDAELRALPDNDWLYSS